MSKMYSVVMHILLALFIAYSFILTMSFVVMDTERRQCIKQERVNTEYLRHITRMYETDCK